MEKIRFYRQWIEKVDDICWLDWGVSIHDLPDCTYRVWFNDGLSPEEAVERAVKESLD